MVTLIRAGGLGPPDEFMPQPEPGEHYDVALAVDGIYRYASAEARDLASRHHIGKDIFVELAKMHGLSNANAHTVGAVSSLLMDGLVTVALLERALAWAKERTNQFADKNHALFADIPPQR